VHPKAKPGNRTDGSVLHSEKRAHISLAGIWAAADYCGRAIRLRARSGVSTAGNDCARDTEPFQLRCLASASLRSRTSTGDNADAASSRDFRKCQRSDHMSEIAASTDIAIKSVLRNESVKGHISS